MQPTVGRIVHYLLTAMDVEQIHRRRVSGAGHGENWPMGAQAHVGNPHVERQTMALMVCAVSPNGNVNGQVFLDGNDSLWVYAVSEGTGSGSWSWPVRQQPQQEQGV